MQDHGEKSDAAPASEGARATATTTGGLPVHYVTRTTNNLVSEGVKMHRRTVNKVIVCYFTFMALVFYICTMGALYFSTIPQPRGRDIIIEDGVPKILIKTERVNLLTANKKFEGEEVPMNWMTFQEYENFAHDYAL